MEKPEKRKKDHIELALRSVTGPDELDRRFHYEPLLQPHPAGGWKPFSFLGKVQRIPMWVSSMTGGTGRAGTINRNLARACNEFGMGMGLGSCRILLDDDACLKDFNMRDIIGDDLPLWANLGIAQIEHLLESQELHKASELVDRLRADGLIVHVNPLQEWFQPEGDLLSRPPLDTIKRLMDRFSHPLIVKEVGQGIGPESLGELLKLPLQAIEFAAFGGTNFSKMELMRDETGVQSIHEPLTRVGEDAATMLEYVNAVVKKEPPACSGLILSGGVRNFLDGYYLINKSLLPSIFGMASGFLTHARKDYESLREYVAGQVRGLELANAYLTIRE